MISVYCYPTYDSARSVLRAMINRPWNAYRDLLKTIMDNTGTPGATVDWSDPDVWIPARLEGLDREIAEDVWQSSGRTANPRHTRGDYRLIVFYELVRQGSNQTTELTELGRDFLESSDGEAVRSIDKAEGLHYLLTTLDELGESVRRDVLPGWRELCQTHSKMKKDSGINAYLSERIKNLISRGLVERNGIKWSITTAGQNYLHGFKTEETPQPASASRSLRKTINTFNDEQRAILRQRIETMDPYEFERFLADLLTEIGYEGVEVTSKSNDKGVDVVGTIKVGISEVREVVQAKRVRGTIGRPVLDQLRGSLYRFNAQRGTIITTGTFTRGTEEASLQNNAAPVTLIDGEALLDLLFKHQFGLQQEIIPVYLLDEEMLQGYASENDSEE